MYRTETSAWLRGDLVSSSEMTEGLNRCRLRRAASARGYGKPWATARRGTIEAPLIDPERQSCNQSSTRGSHESREQESISAWFRESFGIAARLRVAF